MKLRPISFIKNALLELRSTHDTLQSTAFTPLQCQLVQFCICAKFLDTKLSEKSNFETLEGVPAKARIPSKLCNHGNYGELHSTQKFCLKAAMFSKIFEAKNFQRVLVLKLVEISKEKITQTRFTTIQSPFVTLNKHFVRSLRATCAREHFNHFLSSYEYIVNLSISAFALRSCPLNKYISVSPTGVPRFPPRP